jgi:hypothetical protein
LDMARWNGEIRRVDTNMCLVQPCYKVLDRRKRPYYTLLGFPIPDDDIEPLLLCFRISDVSSPFNKVVEASV